MQLKLVSTKAIHLLIEPYQPEQEGTESDFNFDYNSHLLPSDASKNGFVIVFATEMTNIEEMFSCKAVYLAEFNTDEQVGEEFLKSPFAMVNAPAIAYPFLRAFLANVLLNSGYKPTMLPSINFVKLMQMKEKEKEKALQAEGSLKK